MRTDALYALVLLRQGAPLASADRGHGRGGDADHSAQPVGEVARASPMLLGVIKNFPSGLPLADRYAASPDLRRESGISVEFSRAVIAGAGPVLALFGPRNSKAAVHQSTPVIWVKDSLAANADGHLEIGSARAVPVAGIRE